MKDQEFIKEIIKRPENKIIKFIILGLLFLVLMIALVSNIILFLVF